MTDSFHEYDIRGVFGRDINSEFAYRVGRSLSSYIKPKQVVVGRDMRESGPELEKALIEGFVDSGVTVIHIGQVSTPQFYYSLFTGLSDVGVMITASHNPKEFNGFKISLENGYPLSKENGLFELKKFWLQNEWSQVTEGKGSVVKKNISIQYQRMFSRLHKALKKNYSIAVDCANAMGCVEVDALKKMYGSEVSVTGLYDTIDGSMPYHIANPIQEDQMTTLKKTLQNGMFDFGVGFDGDADRAVFFLSDGRMIPPDIITGLLGSFMAERGDSVVVDVRTSRKVISYLKTHGVNVVVSPAGNPHLKKLAVEKKSVLAGEKSGHYIFRGLHYTDSSLMAVVKVLEMIDSTGISLDDMVNPILKKGYAPSEMNFTVSKKDEVLSAVKESFSEESEVRLIDGVSVYAKKFFFNLRKSNTEDLVRLNIEGDSKDIVDSVVTRIERIIARNSKGFE
ncbi:MAG: phosphomannomutase/phosphoglucomutase [Nanobdellota archaeon]